MIFFLLFLLLNSLFFLPRYILERKTSTFFPYKGILHGPVKERIQYLINRYNYDIFRISVDFFFLTVLYLFASDFFTFASWHWLFFLVYLLIFLYQIYYHVFENIYKVEPLFYRDFLLLKTGAQIFFREFNKVNILISLAVISSIVGLYFLIGAYLTAADLVELKPWLIVITAFFGLMSLYSLLTYNYKAFGKIVFPSQLQSLTRNLGFSLKTKAQLENVDFQKLKKHKPYGQFELIKKPNIYFIPIESYGRILYDHPELKGAYKKYMSALENTLHQNAWASATNLSLAPITGGASWVSYSSALFGFDLKDQGVYLSLLNRPEMHQYQHFMRWLQELGYVNYRLAPIAGFQGMKIPWDSYSSFYAINEWIKYEDMNYTGKLYGFGPCPPDQFSLGFAKEYILNKKTDPYCLFFITQNSHSPFTGPDKVEARWQTLSDGTQTDQGSSSIFVNPKLSEYASAIKYQLSFITDFILKEGTNNDIFILIGDHQPPTFPEAGDGLETPVHIITKNSKFVTSMDQYGFESGMLKKGTTKTIRHEAMYSLLVRELVRHYGPKGVELPPYLKGGLDWLNL